MPLMALVTACILTLTPAVSTNEPLILSFVIVNDDQRRDVEVISGDFIFGPPTDFIVRPNVYLRGWYQDEALTKFHDFDAPIVSNTTIYATWDFLRPGFALATIIQSEQGDRFESRTMTLSFPLYEPLQKDVRFQWQSAPLLNQDFQNIGGANDDTFTPFRNGTFQYRVRYRIPIYSASGIITDYLSYYSASTTLTIYGQQTITGYLIFLGFFMMAALIMFIRIKRKVYYEVSGGIALSPGLFRIGEDISLQPKAKKKGHRFLGWYLDEDLRVPFEGFRMPMTSLRLYAKFKKTKSHR